jgi:methionyl-tRNA formyltransferase
MEKLGDLGSDVLSRTIAQLSSIEPRPQDDSLATFAPIMKKGDGLIDWRRPAGEIVNRVRGFQPFPTAFTFMGGKRLTIWRAAAVEIPHDDAPGTVIECGGDNFAVACGGGSAIEIIELQPEGKRRMNVRDFINGLKPEKGIVLGQ